MKKFFLLSVLLTVGFFSAVNAQSEVSSELGQFEYKIPKTNTLAKNKKICLIPNGQTWSGSNAIFIDKMPKSGGATHYCYLVPISYNKLIDDYFKANPNGTYRVFYASNTTEALNITTTEAGIAVFCPQSKIVRANGTYWWESLPSASVCP